MKKILLFLIILLSFTQISVVGAEINVKYDNKIEIKKEENEVEFQIKINNENAYAGAEFGIQCGEDVVIKDVSYNIQTNKTDVTEGQGIHWFSYFSGNNSYKDEVIATVTLQYLGDKNTSIVVDNVSIYTKNNYDIDTYRINNRDEIKIIKEGATNEIVPLDPPEELEDFNEKANSNSINKGNSNNKTQNSNNTEKDNNKDKKDNENINVDDKSQGDSNTNLVVDKASTNKTLLTLLIISLSINIGLVCYIIYLQSQCWKKY